MSGTPIQNRLSDLGSLFKFLQVYPFSDPIYFSKHIGRKMNTLDGEARAMITELLRYACGEPKEVLQLPDRYDKVHRLNFGLEERQSYKSTRNSIITALEDVWTVDSNLRQNMLTLINSLRMICNLGFHYRKGGDRGPGSAGWTKEEVPLLRIRCNHGY